MNLLDPDSPVFAQAKTWLRLAPVKEKLGTFRVFLSGARAWVRTKDLSSISRMLYQLSYTRKRLLIMRKVPPQRCAAAARGREAWSRINKRYYTQKSPFGNLCLFYLVI